LSEEAFAKDELHNPGYEIFIAALSVLSLVNISLYWLIPDESLSNVVLMMDGILSLVFLGDFLYRLRTAESKSGYFFRGFGWADLLASVPVASFKILRVFRLVRVVRLLRQSGARHILLSLIRDRAGSALYTLLLIAFLVLEFGSLAILRAEMGAPGANIETAQDSVWYLIVTMSTVGYGDQYPVTSLGRALGSIVIVIGVGIFGTLTGFLANAFVRAPVEEAGTPPSDGATVMAEHDRRSDPGGGSGPGQQPTVSRAALVRELEELRAQHTAALERIDRILAEER
jgi:Ion transport protein